MSYPEFDPFEFDVVEAEIERRVAERMHELGQREFDLSERERALEERARRVRKIEEQWTQQIRALKSQIREMRRGKIN